MSEEKKPVKIDIPGAKLVPINSLTTDKNNPNRMTRIQLESLKGSIQRWGFIIPVITNKDLLIADGEQKWNAAKELGMKQVPVIRLHFSMA